MQSSLLQQQQQDDDISIMTATETITETITTKTTIHTQDELKAHIRHILELDAQLHELKKQKRVLDEQKRALSKNLMALMKEKDIDSFQASQNKLVYKKRVTQPLGKGVLMDVVTRYYRGDEAAAAQLHQYIFDHLPQRTTESLSVEKKR